MKHLLVGLVALCFVCMSYIPVIGSEVVIVKDAKGKIIERKVTQGNTTRIYDRKGTIIGTEKKLK